MAETTVALPRRVKIGEHWWKVRRPRLIIVEGVGHAVGSCCYNDKVIEVRRDQKGQAALSTFLHELLHAIGEEFKDSQGRKVSNRIRHPEIYALEGPLAQVFLDNPALAAAFNRKRLTLGRALRRTS